MTNFFSKAAVACALTAASFAANAVSYTFSYTVNAFSGQTASVTGSFDADAAVNGLVQNLTNIKASIDGVALDGGSYLDNFASIGGAGQAVASVDGSANNFMFSSVRGYSVSYYAVGNSATAGINDGINSYGGNVANGSWTLSAAPVPEPATYAMLMGGMGLLAGLARRRKTGDRA
ncbi:PEP-CTERM sorting domain-containing protein [Oxalobacteraceae bacterium A2-2]